MENQFPFLQLSVWLTKILSFLSAILSIVGAVVILFGNTPGSGKLASIGVLLMGGIYFVGLFLLSELIRFFLSIDQRIEKIEALLSQLPKRDIR